MNNTPAFNLKVEEVSTVDCEPTIGHKIGSGGSSGTSYLQSTLFNPVFIDLWEI